MLLLIFLFFDIVDRHYNVLLQTVIQEMNLVLHVNLI